MPFVLDFAVWKTDVPETDAPEMDSPETDVPETEAPETDVKIIIITTSEMPSKLSPHNADVIAANKTIASQS